MGPVRPLIVDDARHQEPFASLEVTAAANIGSYIGVPLVLSSGEVFGTLCGVDPNSHDFSDADVGLLFALARLVAFHLEMDVLREDLERELARAATIQAELTPVTPPVLESFDVAGRSLPGASSVGGNFFDWSQGPAEVLSVTLGDAKDQGMAAALVAATVRAAVRAVASSFSPSGALERVDLALAADLARSRSYLSLFHGRLNLDTGHLMYVNGGHGNAYLCQQDGKVLELPANNLPLGMLPGQQYLTEHAQLEPGDMLVLLSDGVWERPPSTGRGLEAVANWCRGATTALEVVDSILTEDPSQGAEDRTILVVRRAAA